MNTENNRCEQLISFFLGEMTEEERQAFEGHLCECPACRKELEQMQEVWSALPYSMDMEEPPEELKAEVLGAIFHEPEVKQPASATQHIQAVEQPIAAIPYEQAEKLPVPAVQNVLMEKQPASAVERSKRRSPRYAAVAVLFILLLGYTGWQQFTRQQTPTPPPDLHLPAQVLGEYNLKTFDPSMPEARGQAWLMKKGGSMQLVLQASGLPKLQGDQAYQVWLVKNGNRVNGGTFRVDAQGNGILTYTIDEAERQFDTIGITLEPDPAGTKPRGKKVLGT